MIDEQRSRDFLFRYDTETGILTCLFFDRENERTIESYLLPTALTACLELLSRNGEAVRQHITPRIEEVRQAV